MPIVALYIRKRMPFRGGFEDFGNTYHYDITAIDGFGAPLLANIIRAAEQNLMADEIEFLDWSMWGPVDGPERENVIFDSGEWSNETGNQVGDMDQYFTGSLLFRWPLPRSPVENRRRWCFKYIRGFGPRSMSVPTRQGRQEIDPALRQEIEDDYVQTVANPQPGDFSLDLCSPLDGATVTGNGILRPYVVTRQIRR